MGKPGGGRGMGSDRAGYVYVYGGEGVYKIGRAKNPAARVRSFPLMPYACSIVLTLQTDDAPTVEATLHQHFAKQRIRGEWFRLEQSDIEIIPKLPTLAVALTSKPGKRALVVTLKSYLSHLAETERAWPESQRRKVPTMKELARAADISPISLSRIVAGKTGSLSMKIWGAILDELNRRGFPTTPNEILYHPPEDEG